ncbi:chromosome segregation protein SMC [Lujinxingia sediminis]|uniref:Chromosome partition protein Smc n=1 Tax=Lujinxingia sediminis TaxID=2480984 RepID=A0ABY0CZN3_9DELT|nr:chromosome segregation protein SMC [Lujinxingia sediminis]RVU48900.1 chromosome segregation protein SMC [Lujinxingia sediminis]
MKLRRIEIVGFKSFRDRVTVDISDGMTCIVGPNGCGKSNVVDAIKWAMGDMSPKSLRGDSMQDVIFAGTEKHRPGGLAEVTLVFENTARVMEAAEEEQLDASGDAPEEVDTDKDVESPVEVQEPAVEAPLQGALAVDVEDESEEKEDTSAPGWITGDGLPRELRHVAEIAITRRLHRSGESEYLINKIPCRLMDIQNLLAGTGLGKQGYSIIEQGQIGFIVNAKPQQRRLIIEEASGITRYKGQRDRAERKLERTELNLQRTRDVLDEITKQLGTLERQARKAEEHQRFSEELRALEIALLLDKRRDAMARATDARRQLGEAKRTQHQSKIDFEAGEEQLRVARVDAHQAERRHADLTESFYKLDTRLNLTRSQLEHATDAISQAEERALTLADEKRSQEERREHLKIELLRVKEELESFVAQPEDDDEAVLRVQQELERLREERDGLTGRRDTALKELNETRSDANRVSDRLQWVGSQLGEMGARAEATGQALGAAREDVDDLTRALSRLTMDHARVAEEVEQLKRKSGDAQAGHAEAREALKEAEDDAREIASQLAVTRARVQSLEEMRERGEGYQEGVRRVLTWARDEGREDVLGPAGDFLAVPEGREAAYAAYLGDRLGDIVVKTRQAAFDALAMLASEDVGRVGCFVLPSPEDDPRGVLAGWLNGLELVDDLSLVPSGSDAGETRAWATARGDILFADGRVVGGGVGEQAETLLKQARDLEAGKAALANLIVADEEAQGSLEVAQEDLVIAEDEVESVREALQEAVHRARGLMQERDNEERERARATARVEKLQAELEEHEELHQGLQAELEVLKERQQEYIETLPGMERALRELMQQLNEVNTRVEARNAELTDEKVRVAQVRERRRHLEESAGRLRGAIGHAEGQIARFAREIEEQGERARDATMRVEELRKELADVERDHGIHRADVKKAKEVLEVVALAVQEQELRVRALRKALDEVQEALQALEVATREAELAMEHIDEQLAERFELTLAEAQPLVRDIALGPEERKSRAEFLRKRIERLGPVNPLAIEEFAETQERHRFQAEQQADLERSVADLRDVIARMDNESRKRFKETFEAVNAKFQEVFPRLFRGGRASLVLTDPTNMLETGVDIEVQPPGKKLQNVTLLSGGEKALTAVSLIFSIFMLKPTPFSVLDEVDAPLDEANVGRFAEMVRDLSTTSQMIVITHNRRTMEAPQMLYGVTMEDAGVSKIVSVRLSEVDEPMAS